MEETSWVEMGDGESEWEALPVEGDLNNRKYDSMRCKIGNATHERRLRGQDEAEWRSDGTSEPDRLRFREDWEASPSLSESVECVSEGVADGLRKGGDGHKAISRVLGDGGV